MSGEQTADSRQPGSPEPSKATGWRQRTARKLGGLERNAFERIPHRRLVYFVSRYALQRTPSGVVALLDQQPMKVPSASVKKSSDAAAVFRECLPKGPGEELWLLAVDGKQKIRSLSKVAESPNDTIRLTVVDVLRVAVLSGERQCILGHNHPDGDPRPSLSDWAATAEIVRGLLSIGLELVDHLVLGGDRFASLRELAPKVFFVGEGA